MIHYRFFATIGSLAIAFIMSILALGMTMNIYDLVIPVFIMFVLCGLIFPTMGARTLGLFPELAGTANAVYGLIMAGGVFVITTFGTCLKTTTQLPLAIVYCGLFCVALILFVFFAKKS